MGVHIVKPGPRVLALGAAADHNRAIAIFGAAGRAARFVVAELNRRGWSSILGGRDLAKLKGLESGYPGMAIRTASGPGAGLEPRQRRQARDRAMRDHRVCSLVGPKAVGAVAPGAVCNARKFLKALTPRHFSLEIRQEQAEGRGSAPNRRAPRSVNGQRYPRGTEK
jgi:hypothetical protein